MKDLPRVTEILKSYSGFVNVPHDILQRACERGTKVHALCANIADGAWIDVDTINEGLKGYVRSFNKWAEKIEEYEIIEKRYTHELLGYTGQVDFVAKIQGARFLVDLKTSAKEQKTYPVQMGAYRELLANNGIDVAGCILVYLDAKGDYPKENVLKDTGTETQVFMAALHCWKYFHQKKRKNDPGKDTDDFA